ncbi:hypothetical protein M378DRAFT_162020 [Amanita muscaria Koide BX008]|uniref:Uncharacterized protein n=1 Tax=Amanita muscaria (strain Koide BX008) TaxID=946122 RepID=A0A0C2TEW3_AMAMK|nr:hypothetical protein M378DRAFT_162020 [Amanita muscaria Koide BX008]
MVSKSFSHTAFKVADLALAGRRIRIDGATPVDGEENKPIITDLDGDERIDDLDKLKLIYNRFKMINDIHSENVFDFVSQSGVTILSAYYGYIQVIKNCKTLFWRQGLLSDHPNLVTNWFASASQQHLAFVEKIHGVFPTAIKNILSMLDILTVPEMVEKLRRDMEWYSRFIASGLEIVYRCAQVINRRDEWQSRNVSKEFIDPLNDLYAVMKANAEFYSSALKDHVPGEYPIISELPGVRVAIKLIVRNGHHHQALAGLVNSWV